MLCAIWYHLRNLNNVKNTHGGLILLVELQASATLQLHSSMGVFYVVLIAQVVPDREERLIFFQCVFFLVQRLKTVSVYALSYKPRVLFMGFLFGISGLFQDFQSFLFDILRQ